MQSIWTRRSVRTFSPNPIEEAHIEALDALVESVNLRTGPYGTAYRILHLVTEGDEGVPRKIGTYGVIKGQRGYLVGICQDQKEALLDIGHAMEECVLHLTGMGIGTCWLGGTFSRSSIEEMVNPGEDEIIAAVIPYGYPTGRKRIMESMMKRAARSSSRLPFDDLFSSFGDDIDGPVRECLEAVRQAPSSMNNQPWRAVVDAGKVHLLMNRGGMLKSRLYTRMRHIDMGIAMQHLEAAASEMFPTAQWIFEDDLEGIPDEFLYIATLVIDAGTLRFP